MRLAKSWPFLIAGCCALQSANAQDFENGNRQGGSIPAKKDEAFDRVRQARPNEAPQPEIMQNSQAANPFDNSIDNLLRTWCDKTSNVKTLYTEFERSIADAAFGDTEKSDGQARFVFPNKARLDVLKGDRAESFVLNGKNEIWHYMPPLKQLRVYHFPKKPDGQDIENNPVPFLVGLAPDKAKERYRFQIVDKTDAFTHVKIIPKRQKDLEDFKVAEVWLNSATFFPDKLVFIEPNNNKMTFKFKGIYTNIEINEKEDFKTPIPGNFAVTHHQVKDEADAGGGKATDAKPVSRSGSSRDGESDLRNADDRRQSDGWDQRRSEDRRPRRQDDH